MNAPSLTIASEKNSYPVFIQGGLRHECFSYIREALQKSVSSYMIMIDENVADLYLADLLASFPENIQPTVTKIASGEGSKSIEKFSQLLTEALEVPLDRQSVIIAVGGGVTGDLAGYVAASYMRGIRFIQMPTTLLAHDSSVGGKTGINHPLGKNLIGAFHAPSAVLYDSDMLRTLPETEWRSGFAEVVKHGFIKDTAFLEWLEKKVMSFSDIPSDILNEMLRRSIAVKAEIVQEDEKENGVRAFLNYGHTLGHALESELGYGKLTHGEAVAIGMAFAHKLSERVFHTTLPTKTHEIYMTKLGYQLSIPEGISAASLLQRMKLDKKAEHNRIRFVLLEEMGKPVLLPVEEQVVLDLLVSEGVNA
ncbi:3-dehydroquinate synthase [Salipaludibacillus neizhouensis]|uniref:3-dehydroquinate synthase n=1 Tax=Salipaludibacillus neizhouensis TaxID=885475 RepID=A0A3A9K4N7_9BACI|nr:3-dehydroquinate synthase [Salipaludibacillus neizhouensis]RKL67587.1 3-dehydroquinate synthase [Salipaludibacillus neizhouensis]